VTIAAVASHTSDTSKIFQLNSSTSLSYRADRPTPNHTKATT